VFVGLPTASGSLLGLLLLLLLLLLFSVLRALIFGALDALTPELKPRCAARSISFSAVAVRPEGESKQRFSKYILPAKKNGGAEAR
jgi:uncharacterized protein (DUF58 family)